MSFPDPYQVAKIAARLDCNIEKAHALLIEADEYCRDQRIENSERVPLILYLRDCDKLPNRMKSSMREKTFLKWMHEVGKEREKESGGDYEQELAETYAEWHGSHVPRSVQESFETWYVQEQKINKIKEGSKAHEKKDS